MCVGGEPARTTDGEGRGARWPPGAGHSMAVAGKTISARPSRASIRPAKCTAPAPSGAPSVSLKRALVETPMTSASSSRARRIESAPLLWASAHSRSRSVPRDRVAIPARGSASQSRPGRLRRSRRQRLWATRCAGRFGIGRMGGRQGLPVKWILVSVAVFLGSVVAFVAMPRPALHWARNVVVQCVEVFTDGSGPVVVRTNDPGARANDGNDHVESRTRETIQSDLAGRARVIDGDTIEVGSARIRPLGVDAPESAQSCLAGEPPLAVR